jgi:hypothetical protein
MTPISKSITVNDLVGASPRNMRNLSDRSESLTLNELTGVSARNAKSDITTVLGGGLTDPVRGGRARVLYPRTSVPRDFDGIAALRD